MPDWFLPNHFYNQYRIQRPGKRGPRNMKSMQLTSAAIFFMTFFLIISRAGVGRGHGPLAPLLDLLLRIICNS